MASPTRVSLREAAECLGVHYMTAYRYVRTGRLPATLEGATWTVATADLAVFGKVHLPPGRAAAARRRDPARPARLAQRMAAGDEAASWAIIEEGLVRGTGPAEQELR